jgi:hypothetical protein
LWFKRPGYAALGLYAFDASTFKRELKSVVLGRFRYATALSAQIR